MNAYSEDLRKKIVEAKERGMPTVEVAHTFGVGIYSVKRYAKTVREGRSLRPKRSPGRPPKADQRARRLLEADLKERPTATLSERREYLRSVARLRVSESTVSRPLRRMGFSRKRSVGATERDEFLRAVWRALVAREIDARRLVFLRTRWARTRRSRPCTRGRDEGSERLPRCLATGGQTSPCWRA